MSDTPETNAVWEDKSRNILGHAKTMERERDHARGLLRKAVESLSHAPGCEGAFRPHDCPCGYMGLLYEVEKFSRLDEPTTV